MTLYPSLSPSSLPLPPLSPPPSLPSPLSLPSPPPPLPPSATPVFTRIPQDVVVARSDIAAFTCNAQSLPAPTIAWVDSNGTTLVGNPFVIAFNAGGTVSASSLQFPANLNITGVRCEPTATQGNLQLTNRLGRLATITIAGTYVSYIQCGCAHFRGAFGAVAKKCCVYRGVLISGGPD